MDWIMGLGFVAFAIYFILSLKSKRNEIVFHVETRIADNSLDTDGAENDEEEKDSWESFEFYNATMLPAKGRYRINYVDRKGLKTEREIEIKRAYELNGKYAVDAHCLLRNAHRSFLSERVQKAINLDSGETVENLALHAIEQYNSSPEGRAWTAINKEVDAIGILIFVCRADGRMMKPERAVVIDYLKRHSSDIPLDDQALDNAIKSIDWWPDPKQFKNIVTSLRKAGEYERLRDLLDCAERIIATQKTIDPMEKAALEILTKASK